MTNCRERTIKVRVRVKGDSFIDQVQLYEGREVKGRDNDDEPQYRTFMQIKYPCAA